MKKLLLFICLAYSFCVSAQLTNVPPTIANYTAFRLNPLTVSMTFPAGYVFPDTVRAETWLINGTEGSKIASIVPTITIAGQNITMSLTSAQVQKLPKTSQLRLVFDKEYILGANVVTTLATGTPSTVPVSISLPSIGAVKINLIGDPSLAFAYASRAQQAASEMQAEMPSIKIKTAGPIDKTIITGRFGAYNYLFSDGTSLGRCYQYTFVPKYDCVGVQLLFGNWSIGSSDGGYAGYQKSTNPINIKVSMYIDGYDRAYFGGKDSYKLYPGQTIKTDPDRRFFEAGRPVAVLIWVTVDNMGDKWPLGTYTKNLVAGDEGYATTDVTMGGTITVSIERGYSPFAVIGSVLSPTKKQNILINGDSIFTGINPDPGLDQGWVRRGLDNAGLPWFRFAVGGDQMLQHLTPPYDTRAAYMYNNILGADIAIVGYGANDIRYFANLAAAKAQYLKYWNRMNDLGIKVYACTILPSNEFNTAQKQMKNDLNDWIRTLPSPVYKVIEAADVAETSRNSNVWKTGYTSDGVHPNITGEIAISAVIVGSDFQ